MEHIRKPIEEVLLQIIAAKVIADLEEAEQGCTTVEKMAHNYREFKIAIVMQTLRRLQEVEEDVADTGISKR